MAEEKIAVTTEEVATETVEEVIPSMDEFAEELEKSFHKHMPGDIVSGPVIGISDSEVIIDLGSYAEGIIKLEELSNDPRFSIKADITIGEVVSATVLREDREGNLLLSRKKADGSVSCNVLDTHLLTFSGTSVKKVWGVERIGLSKIIEIYDPVNDQKYPFHFPFFFPFQTFL